MSSCSSPKAVKWKLPASPVIPLLLSGDASELYEEIGYDDRITGGCRASSAGGCIYSVAHTRHESLSPRKQGQSQPINLPARR